MSRPAPRPLAAALQGLTAGLAPASLLARVQELWGSVAGELVASEARPTGERDGVLTVTCSAAVWAQELDLMSVELLARLNDALGAQRIRELRCRTG
jgi:predicted nucleic acid-binding Zn ribbon protein